MTKSFDKTIPGRPMSSGITNDELYHKLNTDDSLLLVDLRNKTDYNSKHIQGSTRVSSYIKTDVGMLPKIEGTKKQTILICRDGVESNQCAEMLNSSGKMTRYLIGGIENWNHSLCHPSYRI